MKECLLLAIKISALFIYLAICIGVETAYRDPLFQDSIAIEMEMKSKLSKGEIKFFEVISNFGTVPVLLPTYVLIFFLFPLNKSYVYLHVIIYSGYVTNTLKIIYQNPRPFWIETSIGDSCDGGFGNPSGHSLMSSSVYLSLFHIITDFGFFRDSVLGVMLRIFILVLFLALIIVIMVSRIVLGVHSINQILYGGTLGLALYFFCFFVMEYQKFSGKRLYLHIKNLAFVIIYSMMYGCLFIIALMVYIFNQKNVSAWDILLKEKCPDVQEYRKFNNDGLFQACGIFGAFGCHFGIYFLFWMTVRRYPEKFEEINSWNRNGWKVFILRILIVVVSACPFLLFILISDTASLIVIFICKASCAYLFGLFGIYGIGIYLTIRWSVANPLIYAVPSNALSDPKQGSISELTPIQHT